MVLLVERWRLMYCKVQIYGGRSGGLDSRQGERNTGGGGEVGMVM